MHYNDKSRNNVEGELSMDQTQTSDDAPLLTNSAPQSEQTTLLAHKNPS